MHAGESSRPASNTIISGYHQNFRRKRLIITPVSYGNNYQVTDKPIEASKVNTMRNVTADAFDARSRSHMLAEMPSTFPWWSVVAQKSYTNCTGILSNQNERSGFQNL